VKKNINFCSDGDRIAISSSEYAPLSSSAGFGGPGLIHRSSGIFEGQIGTRKTCHDPIQLKKYRGFITY
jgi:hypothetical protein